MFVEYILFDSKGNKKFIIVSRPFRNMDFNQGILKCYGLPPMRTTRCYCVFISTTAAAGSHVLLAPPYESSEVSS